MRINWSGLMCAAFSAGMVIGFGSVLAHDNKPVSSYVPVDTHETFSAIFSRMTAAKPEIMRRHSELLEQRKADLVAFLRAL